MSKNCEAIAYRLFSEWYEYCLNQGVEPESIVASFGEMLLLTNQEQIDRVQEFLHAEG
jgi:hypothetical protein